MKEYLHNYLTINVYTSRYDYIIYNRCIILYLFLLKVPYLIFIPFYFQNCKR